MANELKRDVWEVANQLAGYVGPDTDERLAKFLMREAGEAAKLAERIIELENTRPATPVEGLVRYDISMFGNGAVEMGGGDFVRFDEAEAIVAAKVEQERLRFEGDLDKWMKTIGAGITGYQPEAYAMMDLACQELVKLRTDNAALTARVKELADALEEIDRKAQAGLCAGSFQGARAFHEDILIKCAALEGQP